ncbi:helix-turn-helix domain-containing protein [Streptomyces noursei]|uniref:helix-turn-helix domain-containing protein n=1 Tax=Streptomyces noursei TaxID=1971 RepID=UPI00382E7C94
MGQTARRTARRRSLGDALKQARIAAGVSQEDAASAIHGDKSKVSRIEGGAAKVSRLELETLMDLFRIADEATRKRLVARSTEGRRRSWWHRHGLKPEFVETLTVESDAERIQTFQTRVIPGLLQIPSYASVVIRFADPSLTDEEVDHYTDVRIERQDVLEKADNLGYLCVISEGVLHQQVGGAQVMAEQLHHLAELAQRPNITIRVIPFDQKNFAGATGSFHLYTYPEPMDLDVVLVEHLTGTLCMHEDETIQKYQAEMDSLQALALPSQQSIDLIRSIAQKLAAE